MAMKFRPFSRWPLVVTFVVAITISILATAGDNNSAVAQYNSFQQPVKINVAKGEFILDDYGLIITNDNTGETATNFYTDTFGSPRTIVIDGTITASEGDSLSACVMTMATEEIACDYANARFDDAYTPFYVDMNTARSAYGGDNSYGGPTIDQYQPN